MHTETPNLYIIGFMGTGKTTIGFRVARKLCMQFLDIDSAIEKQEGLSIRELFKLAGEEHFRRIESVFFENNIPAHGTVVSCGGGLPIPEKILAQLKSTGIVVSLFASPETIKTRTDRTDRRPVLDNKQMGDIESLVSEREELYRQANVCISSHDRPIPDVVNHVVRLYKRMMTTTCAHIKSS
ncbi:MAG: hypothetical protein A2Y14_02940 [Verrucomicrobia bacterium GWF2_51_19]|nr:MAG: hypothetical protein A2Y14_02940 [Verrucomicrobia bacterium GWF2_51_19]HCJ11589.1 shikimate kinase [Opitutae bacterium]